MRITSIVLPLLLAAPLWADGANKPAAPAGAAKKEKDKPAKVYTDEDLKNAGKDGKGSKGTVTFLSEPQGQADSSGSAHGSSETGQRAADEGAVVKPVDESPTAPAESGDSGSAGEAAWRSRAREARDSIKNVEKEIARLEAQLEELNLDRQPTPADVLDPNRLQNREAQKAETRQALEAARTQLVAARQALEDLEAEARKAGVPYGWLEER